MIHVRRVIDMPATRSPNVELALRQLGLDPAACVDQETTKDLVSRAIGLRGQPPGETLVPGVMGWTEFYSRVMTFDPVQATVGLFSMFWQGSDSFMYPRLWLDHSGMLAASRPVGHRRARGIGCDPAEGGDSTALAAVDERGLLCLESHKTPNTAVVPGLIAAFARRWLPQPVDWQLCVLDRGGGGKQHADAMRAAGMNVRTCGFGEKIALEPKASITLVKEKLEVREDRVYRNRRAEMAYELRLLLDPFGPNGGWAIDPRWLAFRDARGEERGLRRQMAPIPLTYDGEGNVFLIPKTKGEKADREEEHDGPTIVKLVGFSPDEWDAVMLACRAMLHRPTVGRAGAA